jgi:SAM-dependent methyltransferase
MTQPTILSDVRSENFPALWYDLASTDHFWCEWRLLAFLSLLEGIGCPLDRPLKGVEIGCGNGLVRRQLEARTQWELDGVDIDLNALESNAATRGETFLYDIHDRHPDLREKYDFLILFDVLEHIEIRECLSFLESCLYHLKPEGKFFLNVPALETLRSKYDTEVGHHRRYNKSTMRKQLEDAGLNLVEMRYWGFNLIPVAVARKIVLSLKKSPDDIVRTGFETPAAWVEVLMKKMAWLETSLIKSPWVGTSLLAAATKPVGSKSSKR